MKKRLGFRLTGHLDKLKPALRWLAWVVLVEIHGQLQSRPLVQTALFPGDAAIPFVHILSLPVGLGRVFCMEPYWMILSPVGALLRQPFLCETRHFRFATLTIHRPLSTLCAKIFDPKPFPERCSNLRVLIALLLDLSSANYAFRLFSTRKTKNEIFN